MSSRGPRPIRHTARSEDVAAVLEAVRRRPAAARRCSARLGVGDPAGRGAVVGLAALGEPRARGEQPLGGGEVRVERGAVLARRLRRAARRSRSRPLRDSASAPSRSGATRLRSVPRRAAPSSWSVYGCWACLTSRQIGVRPRDELRLRQRPVAAVVVVVAAAARERERPRGRRAEHAPRRSGASPRQPRGTPRAPRPRPRARRPSTPRGSPAGRGCARRSGRSRRSPTTAWQGTPDWRARVAISPVTRPRSVARSRRRSPTTTARAARMRASKPSASSTNGAPATSRAPAVVAQVRGERAGLAHVAEDDERGAAAGRRARPARRAARARRRRRRPPRPPAASSTTAAPARRRGGQPLAGQLGRRVELDDRRAAVLDRARSRRRSRRRAPAAAPRSSRARRC